MAVAEEEAWFVRAFGYRITVLAESSTEKYQEGEKAQAEFGAEPCPELLPRSREQGTDSLGIYNEKDS